MNIRPANSNDYKAITTLLHSEKLPVEDLDPNLPHFFVAEINGIIAAAAGLERYDNYALLRSVVTASIHRNKALASHIIETIMEYARQNQIQQLYLITTTAEKYFEKKGFIKTDRSMVPEVLLQSAEFNGLCPVSATVMRFTLN